MARFALIHSPIVAPSTWRAVAEELRRRGAEAVVPDLGTAPDPAEPFWRQHARAAAGALDRVPADAPLVLAGHSGAGVLLPLIRAEAGRPLAAYLFVDAGLPRQGSRMGAGGWAEQLRALYASGGRFPSWTDEQLAPLVPDPAARAELLAGLRPPPLAFWEEEIPVPPSWPDAPGALLRFGANPDYDDAEAEARRLGWPVRTLPGAHFHLLTAPAELADALPALADALGAS